jgi:ubiquinone/menaquinone biosynthesis C-methylase UbiE
MTTTETWQVAATAAETYDAQLVPALFAVWAPRLVNAAGVQVGDRVLDVACGTGVVAREAAARVGPGGEVTGLDLNPWMLTVGRRLQPDLSWHEGDASALPYADTSFDRVLCQFGLRYVRDRVAALREMGRVVTAVGSVAIAVWASLDRGSPFELLRDLLDRHAGPEAGDFLRAPFVLGTIEAVNDLVSAAGLRILRSETPVGRVTFPSIDGFVRAQVAGSPIAGLLADRGEDLYRRLLPEAHVRLQPFVDATGCSFPIDAHIVVARPG